MAVEAQTGNYRARVALASAYLAPEARNYDAAAQQARDTMLIDRSRVDAYSVLAAVEAARGDWAELDAVLAAAEKDVPDDLTPCYRAAEAILASKRDPERAHKLLSRYLATEPEGNGPTAADARRFKSL